MKNPYGLKDGRPVSVEDVARGLACGCICPCCSHRLEAHKGELKSHYFAHDDGGECSHAYQTALHILAKDVLAESKRLVLPPLLLYPDAGLGGWLMRKPFGRVVVPNYTVVEADEVRLEHAIGDVIPDIVFRIRDRILLIEIYVTHAVDSEKRKKIESLGLGAVEYDFSAMNRVVTKDDVAGALVLGRRSPGQGWGHWIYHPRSIEVQKEIDGEFLANKDRMLEELRRQNGLGPVQPLGGNVSEQSGPAERYEPPKPKQPLLF
jgi:hypothetical protein